MKKFVASEAMTNKIITVRWDEPLNVAYHLMHDKRIRHLPVTDKEGFVVGILSDRDVQRAMNPKRPGFESGAVVSEFMSWPTISVKESTSIKAVIDGMLEEKVSSFLVTGTDHEVVGIITTDDILLLFQSLLQKEGALGTFAYNPIVGEVIREISSAGI